MCGFGTIRSGPHAVRGYQVNSLSICACAGRPLQYQRPRHGATWQKLAVNSTSAMTHAMCCTKVAWLMMFMHLHFFSSTAGRRAEPALAYCLETPCRPWNKPPETVVAQLEAHHTLIVRDNGDTTSAFRKQAPVAVQQPKCVSCATPGPGTENDQAPCRVAPSSLSTL